jgi:dimeric dUTPase (all-alpha-NTP-PPase superfamily)
MFKKEQFLVMADMQDKMQQSAIGSDWKNQTTDYGMAVFAESAEACDHYGWKWWAKQTPNVEQAAMECVDILHFALCGGLRQMNASDLYDTIATAELNMHPEHLAEMGSWSFIDFMKELSIAANVNRFDFTIYLTVRAAALVDMDSDKMFNTYVGKNVLNKFRKANGYKEGTYIKTWNGAEDNIYLQGILDNFANHGEVPTPAQIESHLSTIYAAVLENNQTQPASAEVTQH